MPPATTPISRASCTSPWAPSGPPTWCVPNAASSIRAIELVVGQIEQLEPGERTLTLADGQSLSYDYLVLSTGCRIVPETSPHFAEEAHHFYTAEAAARLREALDEFAGGRIVIGIAGMPYKCPPAPLEVAMLIEAELREHEDPARDATKMDFSRPSDEPSLSSRVSEMVTPILEEKGIELHTFANVESIDPDNKVVTTLEGDDFPYDLLILVPPHKGAGVPDGRWPGPGSRRLAADRPQHTRGRRPRARVGPWRRH